MRPDIIIDVHSPFDGKNSFPRSGPAAGVWAVICQFRITAQAEGGQGFFCGRCANQISVRQRRGWDRSVLNRPRTDNLIGRNQNGSGVAKTWIWLAAIQGVINIGTDGR